MTSTADRDGRMIEHGDRVGVRFERRLAHPPERVWRALTEPDQLSKWFPADIRVKGDWSAGASISFPFREGEFPTESGEVLEAEPPRSLAYTWGDQELRFELAPADDGGCRLVFTHLLSREESAHTAAGWEIKFEELEAVLDGRAVPEFPEGRWRELHSGYAAEFGIDPAIGERMLDEYQEATKD